MTVICAARHAGKAAIAWDSRITGGGKGTYARKVFRCGFGWAGLAGGLREIQLLERAWESLNHADSRLELMHLADVAHKAFSVLPRDQPREGVADSSLDIEILIVTHNGRIWTLDTALAYMAHSQVAAIGVGAQAALGSLYAQRALGVSSPKALCLNAARAATRLVEGCGPPIRVREVG